MSAPPGFAPRRDGEITALLDRLGLQRYEKLLHEQEIDLEALKLLSYMDFLEIGVDPASASALLDATRTAKPPAPPPGFAPPPGLAPRPPAAAPEPPSSDDDASEEGAYYLPDNLMDDSDESTIDGVTEAMADEAIAAVGDAIGEAVQEAILDALVAYWNGAPPPQRFAVGSCAALLVLLTLRRLVFLAGEFLVGAALLAAYACHRHWEQPPVVSSLPVLAVACVGSAKKEAGAETFNAVLAQVLAVAFAGASVAFLFRPQPRRRPRRPPPRRSADDWDVRAPPRAGGAKKRKPKTRKSKAPRKPKAPPERPPDEVAEEDPGDAAPPAEAEAPPAEAEAPPAEPPRRQRSGRLKKDPALAAQLFG